MIKSLSFYPRGNKRQPREARGGSGLDEALAFRRRFESISATNSGAHMEIPPAVEETPASRLAAPRDHAPLGHVGVLRMRAMRPIVAM